jgi:hypothetical protein
MHPAIAKLEIAARRLQLLGGLEQTEYSGLVAQLREVSEQLNGFERRINEVKACPIHFGDLLRGAVGTASAPAGQTASRMIVQVPDDIMVAGPPHDLRDLFSSLTEYALTVGQNQIELRAEIKYLGTQARAVCATELVIQSSDIPDFLRRKLWDAVGARRGEVTVVSEVNYCRVVFTLPVERRLGTILG